jgi:P2 family phage contractile tail tube protein
MRKLIIGATGGIKALANSHECANATSISLPEIENKGEEISGAGVLGSYAMPNPGQFSAMTTTLSARAFGADKKYVVAQTVNLEIRIGANVQTSDGSMIVSGTRIYMTGHPTKITNGSAEVSKTRDESVEYSVVRYREVVDGEETLLIDQIAGVYKIGGVDQLTGLRAALG